MGCEQVGADLPTYWISSGTCRVLERAACELVVDMVVPATLAELGAVRIEAGQLISQATANTHTRCAYATYALSLPLCVRRT